MNEAWINKEIIYDGRQLRPHWIYNETNLLGDVIASFIGGADVPLAHMVDLADVRMNAPIFSRSMLHFLVEHFDNSLELAVARQRLLVAIATENLVKLGCVADRLGDDIYVGDKKLSVSIATISPVSTLIHFAMNIESAGTPVPTVGLAGLKIEHRSFASKIMRAYIKEIESMRDARCKVRAV